MTRDFVRNIVSAWTLLAAAGAASAVTPVFSIAVRQSDTVAGVGNVTSVSALAVNNQGKWLVEADTDHANTNADVVVLLNGVLQYREDQSLSGPPNATVSSFDSLNLNNNADTGWNLFLRGQTTSTDSGIYFNSTLALWESTISVSPSFNNPTPYIGFFDVKMNDFNQMSVVASVDDPLIPSTVDRAMVRLDYNPMAGTYVENVISKEGDLLLGSAIADYSTGIHNSDINNAGDMLYIADTTAATTVDGVLMRNSTVLAQEGVTMTAGANSRMYEIILGRGLDMNDSGDWVLKANMTGDTLTDEAIIVNNTIRYQEGQSLASIGSFTLESFGTTSGPVKIDNAGNIVWYGDWNDPATTMDSGLFWNDQLIVQEGVTMVGGFLVASIASGENSFDLSDDGQWLIFEATLRDAGGINYNAAVLVQVPAPGIASLLASAAPLLLRRRRP
ncbi:MAG: hypothetical protein JNK58_08730 [Phycisphaerae bacterium]|nr:hypothetical protein [Phycisphaerae bacterium]